MIKQIRFTLRIVSELNDALTILAKKDGLAKNALIIQILKEFIQHHSKEREGA